MKIKCKNTCCIGCQDEDCHLGNSNNDCPIHHCTKEYAQEKKFCEHDSLNCRLEAPNKFLTMGKYPLKVKFIKRVPDPGVCNILSINWWTGRLTLSNDHCHYNATFDDVVIVE